MAENDRSASSETVTGGQNSGSHPPVQGLKMLVDLGPLLVFAIAYVCARYFLPDPSQAIYWATGALMIATLAAVAASHALFGHIEPMLKFTAGLVSVFGTLTLVLHNDQFIKMKPTILYTFFGLALLVGLFMKRFFLKSAFSQVMNLTDEGWQKLTIRWAVFFLSLAALNEFVWRTYSESTWVSFKFPGTIILTMTFAAAQIGLLKKYEAH